MRKRILSCILAVCMIFSLLPVSALADESATSGTCGENVTWTLENGTLTISGEGGMEDYNYGEGGGDAPWYDNAEAISSVIIENGVTKIGGGAFFGCSSLANVVIPDNVTEIGFGAFCGCSSLTSLAIPDGITEIDSGVFSGCSSLTDITIPDGVTEIGWGAFYDCSGLTSMIIPNGVTSIGGYAFKGCSGLTSITIPANVESIGEEPFMDCSSLTAIDVDKNNAKYCSENGVLFNKDKTQLISFPAGMKSEEYRIPDGVTSVSESAFAGCSYLTDIIIPDSVTNIGDSAFQGCTSLTNVEIGSGVTEIGGYAFYDCLNLTSVAIPDGVTSIEESTFSGCSSLADVTIGSKITSIGWEAFLNCSSLKSITIPDSVTSIGLFAFGGCSALTSVTIGTGLTSIGTCAFSGCSGLESIIIPNNVTSIKGQAFEYCTGLKSVTIPDSVTEIGGNAFNGCSSLQSITIPNSVTEIEYSAFEGCTSLQSITIPDSVTGIGYYAFGECSGLTDVSYLGTIEQWNNVAIDEGNGCLTARVIHCSDGDVEPGETGDDNLTWTLNDGTLTISGEGKMSDYVEIDAPWYDYKEEITSVIIESGVTSIGFDAFQFCGAIDVTIPESVTSINYGAFSYCDSLRTVNYDGTTQQWNAIAISDGNDGLLCATINCSDGVIIPHGTCGENLTWVIENGTLTISGTGAMDDYSHDAPWNFASRSLTSVVIENGVTSIGELAFYNFYNLESIAIPASVTNIGERAFEYCDSLNSIVLDENNASYCTDGVALFNKDKTELIVCTRDVQNSYTVPDSVKTIAEGAFLNCDDLREIILPAGLTGIGTGAFRGCTYLYSIEIPNGVTSIEDNTFMECYSLNSITVPESVTSIGAGAFEGSFVAQVNYGGTIAQWEAIAIGENNYCLECATIYCSDGTLYPHGTCGENLTWVIENGTLTISGTGDMYDYCYDAPWYTANGKITSLVIENGVTSIGELAFYNFYNLESVTIPTSVTTIGAEAFNCCDYINDVSYDGTKEQWDAITIDNGNGCLKGATIHCSDITVYPHGSCGDNVVWTQEEGILTISGTGDMSDRYEDSRWFGKNESITSIIIENGVTSIGARAFFNLYNLESVTIPASVTTIGAEAFNSCYSMNEVNYGGTKEQWNAITIDDGNGCLNEATIHCTDGDVEPLKYCGENVTWTLKNGVLTISGTGDMENYYGYWNDGGTAPWEVDDVTSVVIKSGVTGIGNYAFERCGNLTSVTIPESVTSVGEYAFSRCTGLTDVNYSDTIEQWDSIAISEGNERLTSCTIHCTDGDIYPHGECGDNVIWTLEDGTLTISGEGEMYNYNDEDRSPWYGNSESITKLVIEDGVTGIGSCALCECSNLTDVTIPDSVTYIGQVAFRGCTSLTEVTYLGTTQQWIAIEAHGGNGCLARATIRCTNGNVDATWELVDGVLTISGNDTMPDYGWGDAPWAGEETITSIVVEDGATRIGDFAFEDCLNVKSITLPASVTYIGFHALPSAGEPMEIYYDGTKAQWDEIDIVSGELMMNSAIIHCTDGDVFASDYCGNHVKWTLENGILTISGAGEMYSYEDGQCSPWNSKVEEITSIVIENGVTGIGTYAFAGCMNARSISIADSVERIYYGAFMNCDALKNVVLPESLVTVEGSIFAGCDSLESVTVPSTVTEGVTGWFGYCPNFKNIIVDENNSVYTSVDGVLFNKDKTEILLYPEGREAENYQIPDSVTFIGDCAFDNCNNLKYIGIPDNVTEIGEDAFASCGNLTNVTLPDGLTRIGGCAFNGCTNLTNIAIPDSVTSIGHSAFDDCSSLTSVTIPNSITEIDNATFMNCSGLTSIVIPEGVTSIGSLAFKNCSSLTSIVIPDSVSDIGNNAFSGCSALESLTLPDSYTSIWGEAFSNCTSLRTVTIPKTVSFTGNIFIGCTSLEEINVEDGNDECRSEDGVVYSIDYYSSGSNLKIYPAAKQNEKFDIPEGIRIISDYAFDSCSKLKTLTIPSSVSYIENRAFNDCYSLSAFVVSEENTSYSSQDGVLFDKDKTALIAYPLGRESTEYAIPEGVSYIGNYAFLNCNNIQTISIPDSVIEIGYSAFAWSNIAYVNYSGTVEQWNEISVGEDNHGLMGAVIHCSDGDIYPHGNYGKNLSFELRDGTLTISGTGNVVECYDIPWYGYKQKIMNVVIENGVTEIDGLYNCMNLQSITIPDTVTVIGDSAFDGCTSLENVYYGGTAEQWSKIVVCSGNDVLEGVKITFKDTHTHSYTDTVTAPTCTEKGYTTHTCDCGDSYIDSYVPAKGHSFGAWTQTKAPTCTENGSETRSCANCGKTETREIAATGHHYTATVTAPTCTEQGYTTHTCVCGDSYVDSYVAAKGHSFGAWTQTKAPTCTAKGAESRSCANCDKTETRELAALDHDLKHHNAKAATCTEKGWAAYDACSRCDYTTYKEIAATGHHYTDTVTAPTCTAKGYTTRTCACGSSYVDNYTNALGHSYKNGVCTRCNAKNPNYVAAPTISITTSAGHPKLSWKVVDGATKYYIYRSTDGKNYKYYSSTTATSYTNSSTTIGTTYYYKVRAVKVVNGENLYSAQSNAKSIKCVPAAPSVTISRANGKPKLSWKAVSGASKYYIYRSTDGKNYKYYSSTTATSYTNTGAASGTKYYYRIRAIAVVNGANASSAMSTAKSLMTTLATPSVSITTSNGKPKLTWKAVTGADKYYVYRSTDGKSFSYYSSTTKTSYVNSGAKKNTKYYYKVKAVYSPNSNANSYQSKTVSIKATK